MNFSKAAQGMPTLLSFDDARTLFHEFGHALHGLLSDVTYPMISGTSVLTDWVELPSQLFEHWLERPEILGRFAVHCDTGEPMPADLHAPAHRRAYLQPGLCHRGICGLGAGRPRASSANHVPRCRSRFRHRRLRAGRARPHRNARRDRHAPPSHPLPAPVRGRRLRVGLLQLHVVGGARRRRFRSLRGGRRHLSCRHREKPARPCL